MVKEQQDFTVFSKNHMIMSVSVVDDNDAPVNLGGYSDIKWFMMERPTSVNYEITKSLTSGIAVTDAANGIFTVELSSSDMASTSGSYYHEAILIDPASQSYTIMVGTVKVKKSAYDR
jgi:hypothetical protein